MTIDIEKILEDRVLDLTEVADHLFPTNKYPKMALERVMAGKAELDAAQVSRLALLANLRIDQLYSQKWEAAPVKGRMLKFNREGYTAELNLDTWVTKLYHNASIIHGSMPTPGVMRLQEYFDKLDYFINSKTKQS